MPFVQNDIQEAFRADSQSLVTGYKFYELVALWAKPEISHGKWWIKY